MAGVDYPADCVCCGLLGYHARFSEKDIAVKKITLLTLLFCAIAALLSACVDVCTTTEAPKDNLDYRIIVVEGMPCLLVESSTYYSHIVKSVDCDWSKWNGKVEP